MSLIVNYKLSTVCYSIYLLVIYRLLIYFCILLFRIDKQQLLKKVTSFHGCEFMSPSILWFILKFSYLNSERSPKKGADSSNHPRPPARLCLRANSLAGGPPWERRGKFLYLFFCHFLRSIFTEEEQRFLKFLIL